MSDTSIEARIAALEGRIADLERQRWEGPPRLGPQRGGEIDLNAVKKIVEAAKAEVEATAPAMCTTNGKPVAEVRASQTNETGQHDGYIVLCPDERAKGFVRPYRDTYKHVGLRVCGKQRPPVRHPDDPDLRVCHMSPGHEGECFDATGPAPQGCGLVTKMGRDLSETYARDPKFYGATFCVACNKHLPVAEFVWTADGQEVGS